MAKINLDRVPRTLCEAVAFITEGLEEKDRRAILAAKSPAFAHNTVGRYIRNSWSLWDPDCILTLHFRNVHKIWHVDDMSGLILHGVYCHVRNVDPDYNKEVKRYQDYWNRYGGVNPFTGEDKFA